MPQEHMRRAFFTGREGIHFVSDPFRQGARFRGQSSFDFLHNHIIPTGMSLTNEKTCIKNYKIRK
jgi:hypothetical protein